MFGGGDQNFLGLHEWGTIFFSRGGSEFFLYSLYSVTKKNPNLFQIFQTPNYGCTTAAITKRGTYFF